MKTFQVKRSTGEPTQWPCHGETAESALANWKHCFGPGFEIVQPERGLAR